MKREPICSVCGKLVDDWTGLHDRQTPEPGDISICLYCGALHIFLDSQGRIRPLHEEELAELMKSELWPTIKAAQNAAAQVRNAKPGKKVGAK